MSRRAAVCSVPGCPVLVRGGGRCGGTCHEGCRAKRVVRPSSHAAGYDAQWRRTRAAYLLAHPLCQHVGCDQAATDVDHDDGLGPLGPRGHDWSNLVGYCHPHHSAKTALYDGGFGNKPKSRTAQAHAEQHEDG